MKRPLVATILALTLGLTGMASGSPKEPKGSHLQMYTITLEASAVDALLLEGVDVLDQRDIKGDLVEIDVVLTRPTANRLRSDGYQIELWRNADGFTATELAAQQEESGFEVWRSYDEPGGIEDEMQQIAAQHPDIAKLVDIGDTHQGRDIWALKVTKDANTVPDGSRPAVLYSSAQHAREWISVEVNRRILRYFVDNYGQTPEATQLVNTRELWFVLVANPDGYQYSFDVDRLWRKNLRDNDGTAR